MAVYNRISLQLYLLHSTLRSTLALDLTHNIGRQTRAPNTTSTHSNDELITLFETIRLGGVAYSRGCGVFDGITILVEERGALPTSGLDARKAVHITCRSVVLGPTVNAMIMQQSTCQYEEGPARAAREKNALSSPSVTPRDR